VVVALGTGTECHWHSGSGAANGSCSFPKTKKAEKNKINQSKENKQPTMFFCFTFPLKPEKNATKCWKKDDFLRICIISCEPGQYCNIRKLGLERGTTNPLSSANAYFCSTLSKCVSQPQFNSKLNEIKSPE
jgi:hypothetical protein